MNKTIMAAMLAGLAAPALASTTDILIGLDSKIDFGPGGQVNVKPGADAVLVMEISSPAHPKIRASLPPVHSLLGPPTNLQITLDGKLGLVANSVNSVQDGDKWKTMPDDKLYVIDLAASPPKLIDTVTVHKQPSGLLVISHKGDLVLIANRAGKSITALSIQGTSVKVIGEIPTGTEVAGIAITPDGKRAFAVMNLVNKVAVFEIDGQKITYDKAMDIPAGLNPCNIDIMPDGKYAIASATGAGGNNADLLTVIETAGPHPHVVQIATAGTGPEGFAIAPNGKWAVTPLLLGSGAKHADWFYTKGGQAVLLHLEADGQVRSGNRLPLGGLPGGVAFSPDSQYGYVGNYLDKNVQVFRVAGGKLLATGVTLSLPEQPASLRGPAR